MQGMVVRMKQKSNWEEVPWEPEYQGYREPECQDIPTGKMMESSKWSSGLREFVTKQEADEKDGQKNETQSWWKGTRHNDGKTESLLTKRVGEFV